VFIHRETLSAHSACPRKIPEWIVLILENFSENKWAYGKYTIEIVLSGFSLFSFSISLVSSRKVENNSI